MFTDEEKAFMRALFNECIEEEIFERRVSNICNDTIKEFLSLPQNRFLFGGIMFMFACVISLSLYIFHTNNDALKSLAGSVSNLEKSYMLNSSTMRVLEDRSKRNEREIFEIHKSIN